MTTKNVPDYKETVHSKKSLLEESTKIAKNLFKKSGYSITNSTNNIEKTKNTDSFIATVKDKSDNKKYSVNIKVSTSLDFKDLSQIDLEISSFIDYSLQFDCIPVLFIFSLVSKETKNRISDSYKDLVVFDLQNLLYSVKGKELYDDLAAILPFNIEQINPIENSCLNLSWIEHSEKENLISKLERIPAGNDDSKKFEKECCEVLKYIFKDDLSLWQEQKSSNSLLYKFDLICRIKDHNNKTFWSIMENYFNSKYIIFEFKNYTNPITQKEIYTTEKYLYKTALRNVAIIVAKNGFDKNSKIATSGSLRENGKLILLITIDDLKEMYNLKNNQQDPSEILLRKLDKLLSELEK